MSKRKHRKHKARKSVTRWREHIAAQRHLSWVFGHECYWLAA